MKISEILRESVRNPFHPGALQSFQYKMHHLAEMRLTNFMPLVSFHTA